MLIHDEISGTEEYKEGVYASLKDFRDKTKCPYEIGSPEYEKWQAGYFRTFDESVFWANANRELR